MTKTEKDRTFAEYITPLHMDGMQGRMLHLPATGKHTREILLVYGHHASIERMEGIAEVLSRYGNVTLPDLPGFGGMDSFYATGRKPTLDNLADYLASFVRMRYKRRRLTILAMSFGFVVATRMLQRNPDIAKRVDILVSVVGFAHYQDFKFTPRNYNLMRYGASIFSQRVPAWICQHLLLRGPLIRAAYKLAERSNPKMRDAGTSEELNRRIDFEIGLWQANDIRTYMDTTITMFTVDLTSEKVQLPVYHVQVDSDRYFDNDRVSVHLQQIFGGVHVVKSKMGGHAPTVVATAKEALPFIPPKIRKLLASK